MKQPANMTIEEAQAELRLWQENGLQGRERTTAERDRVAALWNRVDRHYGNGRAS
jgi:hypothetical protein